MNWVQVQSWLLSDVVYGLFLNGAPADLCPLFFLWPSPDHIVFPLRRKIMFFLQRFMAATRMLSAVKTSVAPGGGGGIKGRGRESLYHVYHEWWAAALPVSPSYTLQKGWPFTEDVAAESKGHLEFVPNLHWTNFAWLLNQLVTVIDNPDVG